MKRDRYETVTQFGLLIPARESEAMGEATFSSEAFGPSHVRAIDLEELKAAAKKLRGTDAARFDALLSLKGALESQDQLALERAKGHIDKFYKLRQVEVARIADPNQDRELGALFAGRTGLSPEETAKYVLGVRSGPKAAESLRRQLSYEVSEAVGSMFQTQIVLWWFKGAFRPAIYCVDVKAALHVHTFFLAPSGGVGFRICPYDGEQFFQDRPNQDYCCPAHREAHRVARFRDKRKDRKHHGSSKAR